MSELMELSPEDLFNNFDTFCGGIIDSNSTRVSIEGPAYPVIRDMNNLFKEIEKKEKEKKEEYYSNEKNTKFIEMMENTFSLDQPLSNRNRTPFADITNLEDKKPAKPRLPKAPKNLKSQGGKKSAKINKKHLLNSKFNFLKSKGERNKINKRSFLDNRRKRKKKKGQSMNIKKGEEFKNLENSRMNYSNDDGEYGEKIIKRGEGKEGVSLSVRFQKFMKHKKRNMRVKKEDKSQNDSLKDKKKASASFRDFMKMNKSKNSLLKNFKEKMVKKSHHQRKYSNIIPPIPIQDLSKQRIREQIMYGRQGGENQLKKSSRDELKTLKRRTREMRYKGEEYQGGDVTTDRKSTNRLQLMATNDQRTAQELKTVEDCINSSEFLRSQMIKAKGLDPDTFREYECDKKENNGQRKLNQYKKIKKFHMDFGSIAVDIHSIYAKDNYIPTKLSQGIEKDSRNPVPNLRLKKGKGKKILFPKNTKGQRNSSKKSQKKKFYSLSRQLLAGRISKKLDEISKGDKKHQSESFFRSFSRKKSEAGRRRENNSFVLERRHSREKRNVSMDGSKMMR